MKSNYCKVTIGRLSYYRIALLIMVIVMMKFDTACKEASFNLFTLHILSFYWQLGNYTVRHQCIINLVNLHVLSLYWKLGSFIVRHRCIINIVNLNIIFILEVGKGHSKTSV